ncbi:MAG: FAD-dependent oxidoreductase [Actinobacteria bacterium]|nr:FAD-dependent oxidoreductase [Actinomycetota bacterium]
MERELTGAITRSFGRPGPVDAMLRPPCEVACPIHTNAQRYIQLVAEGHDARALAVVRVTNPLPQVIGRICPHPCEEACRRGDVDEPIAICNIKRVASDGARAAGLGFEPPKIEFTTGKKVAIIGSGPSGLGAAHDLALMGVRATIFEKQPEPGGFLRTGILNYRLPKDILDEDIEYIRKMGVEIYTNADVGRAVKFNDIMAEFDAVLIAAGLSESRPLPIPGADLPQVLLAVPFLEAVNAGREVPGLGKEIIVIGGGNVAIDVARSARRVTGGKVTMVCLEADHEMPAHAWEIEDARAEGIEIVCSQGPNAIMGEGKVEGLQVKKCESVFDEHGRFSPTFCETELSVVPGDTVIVSIGQMSNLSFLPEEGPAVNERGILIFDREQCTTTRRGVFASGEVVTGPGAAVNALASGKKAAIAVARYLGVDVNFRPEPAAIGEVPADVADKVKKAPRRRMPARDAGERLKDFGEVETGLDEVDGRCEASRCLLCGSGARYSQLKCIACLTCVRVCPYGAPWADGEGLGGIDPDKCQACGICFTQCPAKAIDLTVMSEEDIAARTVAAIADSGNGELEFGCWYSQSRVAPEAAAVSLPCTGRLSVRLLLHAFESGAKKVYVAVCSEDDDGHFVHGHRQTRAAVADAQKALGEAGLDPASIELRIEPELKCRKAT